MKRVPTISPTRKRTASNRTAANRRCRAHAAPAETAAPPRCADLQQAREQEPPLAPQAGGADPDAGSKQRLAQSCVAKILEKLLKGGLDGCEPALWSQRAFWLLAGTIYQRLAVDCEAIETAELVALAKALAENRRAEGHAAAPPSSAATPSEGGGEAKDELRQLVHELYGLHLPQAANAPDAHEA